MGIDLSMDGFTDCPVARCAPYRKEIVCVRYVEDESRLSRIGRDLARIFPDVPKEPTSEIWAVKWKIEFRVEAFLSRDEFEAEVARIQKSNEPAYLARLGHDKDPIATKIAGLPAEATPEKWAFRWKQERRMGHYLSQQQFDAELSRVRQLLADDPQGPVRLISRWESSDSQSICGQCPVRHPETTNCSLRLASAGTLGPVYDGLALLVRVAPHAIEKTRRAAIRNAHPIVREFLTKVSEHEDPLRCAIRELGEYFHFDDESAMKRAQESFRFYGRVRDSVLEQGVQLIWGGGPGPRASVKWVNGFFGAIVLRESSLAGNDLSVLHQHLATLAAGCDTVLPFVRRRSQPAITAAREFLQTFHRQVDIALRFGLRVTLS